ncbi:pyridoxal-dependent decarboxylase, partial [Klebsiella pneumoniae]|nr:pyridoxal-dependent decarboxylase [Klebsiella pneumoniae]
PVMAQVEPGYLKAALPAGAPQQGEPFEAILDDVNTLVMPGLSHWQHPDFYGYFPSNGTLSSVLGDFLSTGLGVLGLSWQSSPALSELEETTLD